VEEATETMLVGEARSLAGGWVRDQAQSLAGFQGAFMTGSAIWSPADAPMSPASDVDLTIVLSGQLPPVKLGKLRHRGVLLDVNYMDASQVATPEVVLGSYYLAGSFSRPSILLDPSGRLQTLTETVSKEYSRRRWVEQRCEHGWSNAARHFGALSQNLPWHDQAIIWLFGTAAATIVLLSAGLRNPTVRTRYLAVRRLLADYGLLGDYESLLEDLGCARLSRATVERHLATLAAAFDLAASVATTQFFFSSDISAVARAVSIDGSRDLIERGFHREAVFWIVATYARCQTILYHDAQRETHDRRDAGLRSLLGDLGIRSSADILERTRRVEASKPRIWAVAEAIMAATPKVRA
jgi:hypothetical protein